MATSTAAGSGSLHYGLIKRQGCRQASRIPSGTFNGCPCRGSSHGHMEYLSICGYTGVISLHLRCKTWICCHMPASVQGGSLSSPMTHADCFAAIDFRLSVGRPTGTRSYLLYNRVMVYPCVQDISFPKGIIVQKIGGWL
ncbi:hypothetical protein Dsin_029824 [Dipteronia sinensis]|uniref:Uncharacterized protein n=1 Tax=Dipteronia sinensis TaxID=43782 RepID=A0AAD9ZTB8_9ROSI|nr:hypothetical protein Dsin_029824 [Dipteronia sinensis]